jgi:hypothetical protein
VARPSHPPRACHGDGGEGVLGQGEREREEARVEGRGGEGGGSHSGKGRRAASAGVVSWEATARRRFRSLVSWRLRGRLCSRFALPSTSQTL